MKIVLAQLNYHIGNFESNVSKIKRVIADAKRDKADLVVFAELAICGYPPRDFLEFDEFIGNCEAALKEVASYCTGIAAIIGSPVKNPEKSGKSLYNSACFLAGGKVASVHHKALLPNYDVFDEYRYFEPGKEFNIINYKGLSLALTVCEDLWNIENYQQYPLCPMDELIKQRPDIIINISASPFNYRHAEERKNIIGRNAKKYHLPVFYVNHVGSQTELIFDGGSLVAGAEGAIEDELKSFEEDIKSYEVRKNDKSAEVTVQGKKEINNSNSKIERIQDALVLGIRDYFSKMNFGQAILGLSGGIDSAVVLVLACRALGNKNVKALLMPSEFSSEHSIVDAKELTENISCDYQIININKDFESILQSLKPHFHQLPFNIAEENIQARLRAIFLMAFSNKFGYILLNTSNKSELAVGYGTLYGDMCGGLSVIGDLYKTEVYELAEFINSNKEIIPQNIISKAPSAELRPNQKDADTLPEYTVLDKILFQYIEQRKSPREIIDLGNEESLVKRILQMVNSSEYKRYQSPPILRVSPKAFGMGRRMPIVGKYL